MESYSCDCDSVAFATLHVSSDPPPSSPMKGNFFPTEAIPPPLPQRAGSGPQTVAGLRCGPDGRPRHPPTSSPPLNTLSASPRLCRPLGIELGFFACVLSMPGAKHFFADRIAFRSISVEPDDEKQVRGVADCSAIHIFFVLYFITFTWAPIFCVPN